MPKRKSDSEPPRRSSRARPLNLTWKPMEKPKIDNEDNHEHVDTDPDEKTTKVSPSIAAELKSTKAPAKKEKEKTSSTTAKVINKSSTSTVTAATSAKRGRPRRSSPTPKSTNTNTTARSTDTKKATNSTNRGTGPRARASVNTENVTSSDSDDIDDDEASSDPLYEVGQKVLARDQDGIMYQAMVRRRLWGVHQHKQVQIGMVNTQEEIQALLDEEVPPTWHYFVHYFQWNVNWDRWVSQEDVLPLNDTNLELSKTIMQHHKDLMREFKQHSKHIDGGAFLNAWQERLKKILGQDNKKAASKKQQQRSRQKAQKQALEKQAQLRLQSLWNRPPAQAQQLVLNYGLKKILVEEWELVVQFKMLHAVPAQKEATIYHVLKKYLKEMKGIEMNEEPGTVKKSVKDDNSNTTKDNCEDEEASNNDTMEVDSTKYKEKHADQDKTSDAQKEENIQEWIDMVHGICMLFDEALPFRLLYPSEQAQMLVVEKSHPDTPKSQLYGCEFLLRLFCQLPALLLDTYQNDVDVIKPILAKVYDFLRYLQTNQSTVFELAYRKPNQDELRQQVKLDRKKLKAMAKLATA